MSATITAAPPASVGSAEAPFIPVVKVLERDPPKVRPEGGDDAGRWWRQLSTFFGVESEDSAAEVLRQLVSATPMGRRAASDGVNLALETIAELAPRGRVDTLMALHMAALHGLRWTASANPPRPGRPTSRTAARGPTCR
jgi:hypothetical protein